MAIGHRSVPPRIGRRPLRAAAIRRVGGWECFKLSDQLQTAGIGMGGGRAEAGPGRPGSQLLIENHATCPQH